MTLEDPTPQSPGLASRQPRFSVGEDIAQAGMEVVLGVLPVVGSALQTSFAAAANIVSNRQTEAWLGDLATEVDRLSETLGLTVEQVVGDPVFYEALVRGTRAAQGTMRQDKLANLRAVVLNSGSWNPTNAIVQQLCLRLVDELEPEHVAFLEIFASPADWLERHPELGNADDVTLGEIVPTIIVVPGEGAADWLAMRFLDELSQRGLLSQSVGMAYSIKRLRTIDTNVTPLGTVLIDMIRKSPVRP